MEINNVEIVHENKNNLQFLMPKSACFDLKHF